MKKRDYNDLKSWLPNETVRSEPFLMVFNHKDFNEEGGFKRFVSLSCGHYAYTGNMKRMKCPRCCEMIKQGFDWDGYRNLETVRDTMIWREDPARPLNERTDLEGNFYDD